MGSIAKGAGKKRAAVSPPPEISAISWLELSRSNFLALTGFKFVYAAFSKIPYFSLCGNFLAVLFSTLLLIFRTRTRHAIT